MRGVETETGTPLAKSMLPHFGHGEIWDFDCTLCCITERHLLFVATNLRSFCDNYTINGNELQASFDVRNDKKAFAATKLEHNLMATNDRSELNFVRVLEPHPGRGLLDGKIACHCAAKQWDRCRRVMDFRHPINVGLL